MAAIENRSLFDIPFSIYYFLAFSFVTIPLRYFFTHSFVYSYTFVICTANSFVNS